jgi:release factor glutamine methyltransferase
MVLTDINAAITCAAARLDAAGIAQPRREAASLLAFSLGRDHAFLIAHTEYVLTASEERAFEEAVSRRSMREPFQLIVGRQEFYGFDFEVESGVLIPRPETETIVERAIDILSPLANPEFLDLGVGTGCISISILRSTASARATAADISEQSLELAERNARRHKVLDRLRLIESDLFAGIGGFFDLIVSNPPYIPAGEADGLQPEVKNYDPPEALFAGKEGLDIIMKIVAGSPRFLKPGGFLIIEIGQGQAACVKELFSSHEWRAVEIIDDLQGIPRTVVARYRRRG